MKQFLFIYGTLLPDIAPSEILDASKKLKFIGKGFVFGRLYDLGDYPAAILNADGKIFGRVFQLPEDENILPEFDKFEGYSPHNLPKSLYLRKKVNVFLNDKTLSCWVYEYNQDISNAVTIESGNYSRIQTN